MRLFFTIFVLLSNLIFFNSCKNQEKVATRDQITIVNHYPKDLRLIKSDSAWKELLSPLEYRVLRQKETERPGSGSLLNNHQNGIYICKACGLSLFDSDKKFESGTGWPSFYDIHKKDNIATSTDYDLGYMRTELLCGRCEGHLGHVFEDGPAPTGLRYCINSVSLDFKVVIEEHQKK